MKKRIIIKNEPQGRRSAQMSREERLQSELRENLKKRKAQKRAQNEAEKANGSN